MPKFNILFVILEMLAITVLYSYSTFQNKSYKVLQSLFFSHGEKQSENRAEAFSNKDSKSVFDREK
jgi:hypothetical protein